MELIPKNREQKCINVPTQLQSAQTEQFQPGQDMTPSDVFGSYGYARSPLQLRKIGPTSTNQVVQRIVQVGAETYRPRKRGFGIKDLVALVDANKSVATLRYGWKAKIKKWVNEPVTEPRPFTDINDLVGHLTRKKRKTASDKNQDQDVRIQGMNTGYGPDELRYGKFLSHESMRAYGNATQQIKQLPDFLNTVTDLEDLSPDLRSTSDDFTKTDNSFMNLLALESADLSKLDFQGPNGVEIDTQGYSSMGDRSVDPHTLSTNFGFGTIKIGPDISTYMKEMQSTSKPDPHQMDFLNGLEMHRFPHLAPQTSMKRTLYDQGNFSKDQGMGFNHSHSSVEFVGAISGSSMTQSQRENMRKQQTRSNYAILETAFALCPDVDVGTALSNGKELATPRQEMDALKEYIDIVDDVNSDAKQKLAAKRKLRKVLMRMLRGSTQIEEIVSDDETNYPTSPYNPTDYL
ncbi:hypothetical protein ACO0LD_06560 [Undibacterium sp. Ji83W]|uniref:hypothetical protein n=1 Tax=Undibacterium sp. Ji83W TaxID=3413043 RepID=UPI003BEF9530